MESKVRSRFKVQGVKVVTDGETEVQSRFKVVTDGQDSYYLTLHVIMAITLPLALSATGTRVCRVTALKCPT